MTSCSTLSIRPSRLRDRAPAAWAGDDAPHAGVCVDDGGAPSEAGDQAAGVRHPAGDGPEPLTGGRSRELAERISGQVEEAEIADSTGTPCSRRGQEVTALRPGAHTHVLTLGRGNRDAAVDRGRLRPPATGPRTSINRSPPSSDVITWRPSGDHLRAAATPLAATVWRSEPSTRINHIPQSPLRLEANRRRSPAKSHEGARSL